MADGGGGELRRIFELALAESPSERAEVLRRECGGDTALRERLEAMIRAAEDSRFLGSPTVEERLRAGGDEARTIVSAEREGPGTVIGPYKLLQQLGEGGFGTVFMAEQERPVRRRVALKIIKLGMDTKQVVARFEQERQALAMMEHPHIAKVLDAGATESGRPYFVMELVKGDPIVDYCDRSNLGIGERLDLFVQVCGAVQHAHTKGVIHRDIKPTNILVSTQDGRPHAKVIDFGIAKATASKLTEKTLFTEHRALIGTPEYMSPEQAEGSLDIDTRTDVYSLGVLLYELLTGTTPFSSGELRSAAYGEIQRIIREVDPPKPSTRISKNTESLAAVAARRSVQPTRLNAVIRGELDWIVMKAMEKDRQRRYESASGLGDDVRRYLEGDAVLAAPPSAGYRARKFVRRNKGRVVAGALVAGALVLGMVGTTWQALRAADRADAAEKAGAEATAARDAERARVSELEQVVEFQYAMLSGIEPSTAGVKLTEDVVRRHSAALEAAGVAVEERGAVESRFRQDWVKINSTDVAKRLIDETILKPATKEIDTRFADQPVVAAALRQALAERYRELGLYQEAYPLQVSALEIRRRELGPEHAETLATVSEMAMLLHMTGKDAEAEPYIVSALEAARRVLGNEHPHTLTFINNAGLINSGLGRLEDAEKLYKEAFETRLRILGADDPIVFSSAHNYGSILDRLGREKEAEAMYRLSYEGRRRVLGIENPLTITSMHGLAVYLQDAGRFEEAEPLFKEALELNRKVRGEEHPTTLVSIASMGVALNSAGRTEESAVYCEEAVKKSRVINGDDNSYTVAYVLNYGAILSKLGRLEEAEVCYEEAVEKMPRLYGEDHPSTVLGVHGYGQLLRKQKKYKEALELLAPREASARRAFPGGNARYLAVYLEGLALARMANPPSPDRFPLAEANLIEAHKRFTEAGQAGKSGVKTVTGTLADLYKAWDGLEPGKGYDAKATEWATRAEELKK